MDIVIREEYRAGEQTRTKSHICDSRCNHIMRFWGLGFQYKNFGGCSSACNTSVSQMFFSVLKNNFRILVPLNLLWKTGIKRKYCVAVIVKTCFSQRSISFLVGRGCSSKQAGS